MSTHPAAVQPKNAFKDEMRTSLANREFHEPGQAAANSFKVGLFSAGVQIGWLGQNGGEWAVLTTDASQAAVLELYPYKGVSYYRIKGSSRYMSVSNDAYIGFYNWLGATGFTLVGTHLVSDHNHQKLSLYSTDNKYLYAWDQYTVLEVSLVP